MIESTSSEVPEGSDQQRWKDLCGNFSGGLMRTLHISICDRRDDSVDVKKQHGKHVDFVIFDIKPTSWQLHPIETDLAPGAG